jgi:hypothetical protein
MLDPSYRGAPTAASQPPSPPSEVAPSLAAAAQHHSRDLLGFDDQSAREEPLLRHRRLFDMPNERSYAKPKNALSIQA